MEPLPERLFFLLAERPPLAQSRSWVVSCIPGATSRLGNRWGRASAAPTVRQL